MWALKLSSILFVLLLFGCANPSKSLVQSDLSRFFSQQATEPVAVTIQDAFSGEGDSATVYLIVDFSLRAIKGTEFMSGWFKGVRLQKNQRLISGRATMLYQKIDGNWQFNGFATLDRSPILEK